MKNISKVCKKKEFILSSLLIALFLTVVFYNIEVPVEFNDNNNNFDDNRSNPIKLPKLSGQDINITTPENKTYRAPMSGYYPATHDYEHVPDGSLPDDYFYTLGGTFPEPSLCGAQVVSYKTDAVGNRHDKVLELKDYSTSSINWIRGNFLEPGSTDARNCTIEFYALVNMQSGTFYQSSFGIDGDLGWIAHFQWYKWASGNPDIRYWDGTTTYDSGIDQPYNRWYRYSIDISCDGGYAGLSTNQWRFRIYNEYDTLIYTSAILDLETNHSTGGAYRYTMASSETQTTINQYIDAIGITGLEDNYQIGDNEEEGLLLSFNNGTTLDWIGYSLDDQANKTILGNATIPMPDGGLHTIQVFGNDSLGTIYQSDVRYFTICPITLITPENKTYTGPMSGYYLATHDYEHVPDGSLPDDYFYTLGGTYPQPSLCGAQVVPYKTDAIGNRHDKVLELKDYSTSSINWIRGNFLEPGSTDARNCTIEFYALVNMQSGTFYQSSFGINGDLGWIARLQWYKWASGNPDIRYWDGEIAYDSGIDQPYNRWYRYSIDISCDGGYAGLSANQWRFRIYNEYGILIYTSAILDLATDHPTGGAYRFTMASSETQATINQYVDAIGITGLEDDYQIGDNEEEGLLLSFKTSGAFDWMGYSLDGQANKTILGNTTIPMPAEGPHKIQVFGEDPLGMMYQSDLRYFSIDINPPTSSISFTPYSGINKVNITTLFTLSADDGLGSGVSAIMYQINDSGWIEYNTPFDLSGFVPGQYNISFYAFDLVGHIEKTKSLIIELVDIDIDAPISWIIFIPHSGINQVNRTTNFALFADDGLGLGVSAIMYKINDLAWIEYNTPFDLSGLVPGQYNISFYAVDVVGNTENINSLIVELVDIDAPTSWITFIPHSGINQVNRTTLFTLSADDGIGTGVSAIKYQINESGWIVYNIPFDLSGLVPGQYNILFYAIDLVGNTENINSLIVELMDIDAPTSWITFIPHSGINQVNRTTNFTLFADDDIGTGVAAIMYQINESGWIVYNTPFNLSDLNLGQYIISFYAIDLVGNTENINSVIVELVEIDTGPGPIPDDDDDDDDDDDEGKIPFSNLFIFFMILGVIGLVFYKRRKFKK